MDYGDMEERRFNPSPKKQYVHAIFMALFLAGIATYFRDYTYGYYNEILLAIFGFALLTAVLSTISKLLTTLELEENSFSIHKGIINTKSFVVPYNQITNANLEQSLLDRVLGTATIELDTAAGGAQPEVIMRDMPIEKAKMIVERTKSKEMKKEQKVV